MVYLVNPSAGGDSVGKGTVIKARQSESRNLACVLGPGPIGRPR